MTAGHPLAGECRSDITVVLLTFNEVTHIRRCIERAWPVARRIVVIDSLSTDGTQQIARELGAEVYERPFTYHAEQLRWGISTANISDGWILRLDCDEYLQPALVEEVRRRVPALPAEVSSIEFRRRLIFEGRWIRWGGFYPTVLVRMWRPGAAQVEDKLMDEQITVISGRTIRLTRGDLVDENLNGIAEWTAKHNGYSTKHMIQFMRRELGIDEGDGAPGRLAESARSKRFLRDNVYATAPLYIRSVAYFFYRYVVRLGFLDGKQGFVWHVLQGFWHMLLIDAKIAEARRMIARQGLDAYDRELKRRSGLSLFESRERTDPAELHAARPSGTKSALKTPSRLSRGG